MNTDDVAPEERQELFHNLTDEEREEFHRLNHRVMNTRAAESLVALGRRSVRRVLEAEIDRLVALLDRYVMPDADCDAEARALLAKYKEKP